MIDDIDQKKFEWIRAEQDLANERISAYTEADQKIVAVVGTLAVAVVGLSTSKISAVPAESTPYILFLVSVLMCFAINGSSLYSSLALIYLERKFMLSARLGELLGCDPDIALSHSGMFRFSSINSYRFATLPYFLFKGLVSLSLVIAGALCAGSDLSDWHLLLCFGASLIFSILCGCVVFSHAYAALAFVQRARLPRESGTRPPCSTPDAEPSMLSRAIE